MSLVETLFQNRSDPSTDDKLNAFKDQLKTKLQHDYSVRKERRSSLTGLIRPRCLSGSTKRGPSNESEGGNVNKASRSVLSSLKA